jgi:hypothetical protein
MLDRRALPRCGVAEVSSHLIQQRNPEAWRYDCRLVSGELNLFVRRINQSATPDTRTGLTAKQVRELAPIPLP